MVKLEAILIFDFPFIAEGFFLWWASVKKYSMERICSRIPVSVIEKLSHSDMWDVAFTGGKIAKFLVKRIGWKLG